MSPPRETAESFTYRSKVANLSGSMQKVFDNLDGEYAR